MTTTTSVRVIHDTVTAPELSDLLAMQVNDVLIIVTAQESHVIVDKPKDGCWVLRQDEWPEQQFKSATACMNTLTRRMRVS